jgi:hypothetical protein
MSTLTEVFDRYISAPRRESEVRAVRRAAFAPELRAINEQTRTITFTSSTESVDRYGDILRVSGWKLDQYRKNPIFLWSHRSQDPPIGRTLDIHVETSPKPALVQTVQFADKKTYDFADTVFQLFKGKFLTSVSVGFLPLEQPKRLLDESGEWSGGYEFTSMELLETSAVPVPANPDCVARALDAGIITKEYVDRCFVREDVADVLAAFDRLEKAVALVEAKRSALEQRFVRAIEELNVMLAGEPWKSAMVTVQSLAGKHPETIASVADLESALRNGAN